MDLGAPAETQVNSPSPIPLTLNIAPEPDQTSVETWDIPRTVRLDRIRLVVHSTTKISPPWDSLSGVHHDAHSIKQDLQLQDIFRVLETPIAIGEMLHLVLLPDYVNVMGRRNIFSAHSHSMSWELSLTVVGNAQTVDVSTAVELLPEC
ncbi:hypothetical protein P168DRAFT_307579 [Aspergillus campestris IBT 28561]|uniref:Uncharacterized protein n=1 Tax=Aspergillus campestris (strain IBT 28561) TaxID=1392248 RepID=A0A2I1CRI7_ASPC2|nr:uncharacterized protein P168DRAFT_307579 [Aspergillus campestris IBT 28561]PKY00242.1 hypothetical protein P168DRAFT_307579 [Aspergillus campestris IBT 28561]